MLTQLIADAVATLRADARLIHVVHQRATDPADRDDLSAEVRHRLRLADDLERAATPTAVHVLRMVQQPSGRQL